MNPRYVVKRNLKNLLYTFFRNPVSQAAYNREVRRRSELPFTDIESLSRPINMFYSFTKEIQPINNWYGHAYLLKTYAGLPLSYQFKFNIEHGFCLNDEIPSGELQSGLPTFITYAGSRVDTFAKHRFKAFNIGPFILYAPYLLDKTKLYQEKKRLGKCLLFFPSHSSKVLTLTTSLNSVCRALKKLAKGYRTVRVCVYWMDVLKGHHRFYQNCGFECVTAGHIMDPNFLPRLKSIIECADMTLSSLASSQVGFCINLNKPHHILPLSVHISGDPKLTRFYNQLFRSEGFRRLTEAFYSTKPLITSHQRDIVREYFGNKHNFKSREQLKNIIRETEQIYSRYSQAD